MGRDLVLLTGATGFIGSCVLRHLLEVGYNVRIAVRSVAKVQHLFSTRPQMLAHYYAGRLKYCIVPDISARYAYEHALFGVTYVIHMASPVPKGRKVVPPSAQGYHFIIPAVLGTINLLSVAAKTPTVRRVVITSSLVALVPLEELDGGKIRDAKHPITTRDRTSYQEYRLGQYKDDYDAYANSKIGALRETERWFRAERPKFDYVFLHPGCVLGRHEGATSPKQVLQGGKNAVVLALLLGGRVGPVPNFTAHVDDVARAHVTALLTAVKGNQNYILGLPAKWDEAAKVAKLTFPRAWARRHFTNTGSVTTMPLPVDTGPANSMLGLSLKDYTRQVASVLEQWLELSSTVKADVSKPRCKNLGQRLCGKASARPCARRSSIRVSAVEQEAGSCGQEEPTRAC